MKKDIVPVAQITQSIHFLRGQKVMLDYDLAALYGVEARALNQAVKRNVARFPADFMFQLSAHEAKRVSQTEMPPADENSKDRETNSSQFVMSLRKHRGKRYLPYVSTEQGVAMLSSVLKSERAAKVNIAIMRAFVKLRAALEANRDLAEKFTKLEKKIGKHDAEIAAIIDAIRQLMAPPQKPRREIGFHVRESSPRYGTRERR